MAALFSFAYLAAIYISGTLGSFDFGDLYKPETARYMEKHFYELNPWERQLWLHRNDPKLSQRDFRYIFEHHNHRQVPSTVKTRRKPVVFSRRVDQTWSKEENTGRRPQNLRELVYSSRIDGAPVHASKVYPNGLRRTVTLANDEFSANDLWLLMQNNPRWTEGKAKNTILKDNLVHSESGVEANKNGTSEKDVKSEADSTTTEDTDITETVSSEVEETSMPPDLDKVNGTTQTLDDRISESNSSSQDTTVTVKETVTTVPSTVDLKEMSSSTSNEIVSSTASTVEDTASPSMTTFPSSEVTVRETVSATPSTASDSSSKGTYSSKTPLSSSTVSVSETVSSTPSTAGDSSSKGTSSSTTPLSSSTVSVSETMSSTPSTATESSSIGGTSTSTAVPEHVIVLPRIRTARIVLSSVLLVIGLVAVAVAAVCIFRERRRKLKYDQLKLLP